MNGTVDGIHQISYNGGGSGGSIMLQYSAIQGSGTISARGGDSADLCTAGEGK
jgi:hypothetical protein